MPEISDFVPTISPGRSAPTWIQGVGSRAGLRVGLAMVGAVFCLALFLFLGHGYRDWTTRGDLALWDYIAQGIALGEVPYRDMVDNKTPLSGYLGALAILLLVPLGVDDLIALRLCFLVQAAAVVTLVYSLGSHLGRTRIAGLISALALLSVGYFAYQNSRGVEPKTTMILFGLASALSSARDRPFQAGAFGFLSALAWQPGALFIGTALLAASRYGTAWRDGRVLRCLAGVLVPGVITVVYFWMEHALTPFYHWTLHYNATVYGPETARPAPALMRRMVKIARTSYEEGFEVLQAGFVATGCLLIGSLGRLFRPGLRALIEDAPRHCTVIALGVYGAFCLINVQGAPDLLPLVPLLSLHLGLLCGWVFLKFWQLSPDRRVLRAVLTVAFASGVILPLAGQVWRTHRFPELPEPGGLQMQREGGQRIVAILAPGDRVYANGRMDLLTVTGLRNCTPYISTDRGKDSYLRRLEPGGFRGWFQRLQALQPRIVQMGVLPVILHRQEFRQWLQREYVKKKDAGIEYYVRLDNPG